MAGRLDGKVAVITGAASGIGLATAELFIAEGAKVVAADILDDRGEALAARFPEACVFTHCDVTDVAQVRNAIDGAVDRFGGLDILVNNAGAGGTVAMVEDIEPGAWDWTLNLLVRSVVFGTKYAIAHMRARGGGSIINMASAAGVMVGGTPFSYSVSKQAVMYFSRAAAIEVAPDRIRVNAICPGVIATPIWGKLGPDPDLRQADQTAAMMAQIGAGMQPIPKSGLPEDIAQTCLHLASDASAFVTGQSLIVDGGLTLGRQARTKATLGMITGASAEEATAMYEEALAAERKRFS